MYLTRSDGELCIGQLAVHASFQRRGVGSALMDRAIATAMDDGESTIVLNTQSDVAWNQPWYETFGFQVVPVEEWTPDMRVIAGEQTAVGLDWRTRVHMRLRLNGDEGLARGPGARALNDRGDAAG
jgi:ribosomal protein S18 acetylase RimI-like enzyme